MIYLTDLKDLYAASYTIDGGQEDGNIEIKNMTLEAIAFDEHGVRHHVSIHVPTATARAVPNPAPREVM